MKNILIIIASNGFQEKEYGDTRFELEKAGCSVKTASSKPIAVGANGLRVQCDLLLDNVDPNHFDAIVWIGGPGSREYFDHPVAHDICRETLSQSKLLGAICAAPGILARAGVLKDKKMTCWPGEELVEMVVLEGANYTEAEVEQDGLLITGNGPMAAHSFGKKIADALIAS